MSNEEDADLKNKKPETGNQKQMNEFRSKEPYTPYPQPIKECSIMKIESNEPETPPMFKTWTHWYILVIGFLVFLIVLFYVFTKTMA